MTGHVLAPHDSTAPVRWNGVRARMISGGLCVVWVLSASGPVSFCQLAGSPASHGRLYVARAVHCQVRQVSSAQLLSVGCSCRSCPATAGVGRAQLPTSAGLTSGPSAIRSRCSCSPLVSSSLRLSCSLQLDLSRLTSSRFAGHLACLPRSVWPPLSSLPPILCRHLWLPWSARVPV